MTTQTRAELREEIAKAFYESHSFVRPWEKTPAHIRAIYWRYADVTINRIETALAYPREWMEIFRR